MGRRIEASGGIWLVRLHGCADRLRHRVYISRPTPPLEREATERHDGEQTAQQYEGDSESGGLRLFVSWSRSSPPSSSRNPPLSESPSYCWAVCSPSWRSVASRSSGGVGRGM